MSNKKTVWYQSYIDRIQEKLKEFDDYYFEFQDFTKHKYYATYQVFKKGKGTIRIIFVATKFQKNIDIYTKPLNHGEIKENRRTCKDSDSPTC